MILYNEENLKSAKRQKGNTSNTIMNTRCRLCKSANEDIVHIIASYPMMSALLLIHVITYLFDKTLLQILFIMNLFMKNQSYQKHDLQSPE